jgi:hypothetical protein
VKAIQAAGPLPDIYLILLDSHTRSDVLAANYNLDNSAYTTNLENLGFYVADCSQSNYPTTKFSVSSLMNMNYLQDEFTNLNTFPPLGSSRVKQMLDSLGYTTIAFENRSESHFDLQEDILLSRNRRAFGIALFQDGMNEFESMMIDTSLLRIFRDMPQLLPGVQFDQVEYGEHYLQTRYILETLTHLPDTGTPRFVYAHLLVPHEPYIFTPEGDYKYTGNIVKGYRWNTEFIDREITTVVTTILRESSIPPVIIIQGDHGPAGDIVTAEMRLSILNAYYVKPDTRDALYPGITPVNSFRVIFNGYFNGQYPLLEDRSYFAYSPADFIPDTIILSPCSQ